MTIAKDKTDSALGWQVQEHLKSLGIETPIMDKSVKLSQADKIKQIESLMTQVLYALDLDLLDDSLAETPKRIAKMFVNEIFSGLDYTNFPKATVVENKFNYDEMVMERNIIVNSTCEHHLLPIIGNACVAYIPKQKVLGLSKLNRIVDFFARRPQIQERLTAQIHATLCFLLDTDDVAVVIEAEHMCVKTRGVMDACSDTITSQLTGKFRDSAMRSEFFALAKGIRS